MILSIGCPFLPHFLPLLHLQHDVGGRGCSSLFLIWMQPTSTQVPTPLSTFISSHVEHLVWPPDLSEFTLCHHSYASPILTFSQSLLLGASYYCIISIHWIRNPCNRNKELRACPGPWAQLFTGQVCPYLLSSCWKRPFSFSKVY